MHDASPTRRHIALYAPSLEGGGAERVMVMLANSFATSGHRVDLVLAKATGPYLAEVADTVQVVDLQRSRVLTSLLPLRHYMQRARPEVMLSALNHSNIIAILARMLSRTPLRLVVSEHNSLSQARASGAVDRIIRGLIRYLYPSADAIVCVSDGIREEMARDLRLPLGKLHCVYNPLNVDRIHAMMDTPVDHPWLSAREHPVILAAGRLTEQKDYPNLLRAFARMSEKRQARLLILGQGEDEVMLKRLTHELAINDHVEFLGFQPNPFAWMNACDLYVLSSRWEGLPGTLLEALACNARIVSTNCRTGPDEILEGGRWGDLVPVNDPDALATAMENALNDTTPRKGRQRAEAFRPERAAAGYAQVMGL